MALNVTEFIQQQRQPRPQQIFREPGGGFQTPGQTAPIPFGAPGFQTPAAGTPFGGGGFQTLALGGQGLPLGAGRTIRPKIGGVPGAPGVGGRVLPGPGGPVIGSPISQLLGEGPTVAPGIQTPQRRGEARRARAGARQGVRRAKRAVRRVRRRPAGQVTGATGEARAAVKTARTELKTARKNVRQAKRVRRVRRKSK
jgi:hypothetical protein